MLLDKILMAYHIIKYHLLMVLRELVNRLLAPFTQPHARVWPEVTIFISSFNTVWPLKLTLASMQSNSSYEPKQLIFGENDSKDGSREFLEGLAQNEPNVTLVMEKSKPHGLWIDYVFQRVTTPYLVCVDSDIMFFKGDFLKCAIDYMEINPGCWLLAADRRPSGPHPERLGLHCPEALSTWLFIVRSKLKEKITSSFLGCDSKVTGPDGKPVVHYECGATVLEEMQSKGLRYDVMPWWMRQKFHHFGSLSWVGGLADQSNRFAKMKQYQKKDIQRRVSQYREL